MNCFWQKMKKITFKRQKYIFKMLATEIKRVSRKWTNDLGIDCFKHEYQEMNILPKYKMVVGGGTDYTTESLIRKSGEDELENLLSCREGKKKKKNSEEEVNRLKE